MTERTGPWNARSLGEVDDLVQRREQGVDVVGHQQGGNPLRGAHLADQPHDGGLIGQVEAVQRLVQDQQARSAHQRLRDQDALLLSA